MSSTRIHTLEQLVDYVHHLCHTHPEEWNKNDLLSRIHRNIVSTMKKSDTSYVNDKVLIAYFYLASLLSGETVSKHRIISTIDAISEKYTNQ